MADTATLSTLTPTDYKPRHVPRPQADRIGRERPGSVSDAARAVKQLISFIIPVKDESPTLGELYSRIMAAAPAECEIEIVFIDDGSADGSWETIENLARHDPKRVRGIRFRHNRGKAAALTAGFRAARGQVVFTLDADLQDDPVEIPRMLAKLDEGFDIVSGWKRVRHDPWHKVFPSRIFNWMLSRVSGVRLHDHNCGFKCYRAEVTHNLTLHGELHRLIPSLASIKGYRTAEVPVLHHPRREGVSKYGFERYLRGLIDMLVVGFMKRFRERPAHFMGSLALLCLFGGAALMLSGAVAGLAPAAALALLILGAALIAASVPTFACGLVAELVIRGGLASFWRLPISRDTAFSETSQSRGDRAGPSGFRRIAEDYLPH